MRIGLTGGTGFIGQYLIRDYGDKYEFIAASSKNCFVGLQKGAVYESSDYSVESFQNIFSGCDAVIHLGSHIPQQVKQLDSIKTFIENITISENVFIACHECGIKNVVNTSSVSVYDKLSKEPYQESGDVNPSNVYGVTKLAIEKLANLYNMKRDMRIKSLRVSQVLGYRDHMDAGFFSMLINHAKRGEPITVYGAGIASRDYIYVKDVVTALMSAVEAPELAGVFNVSMGKSTSNIELANTYAQVFDNRSLVVHVPVDNEDKSCWEIDISKARVELGFSPRYDLYDMVADIRRELEAAHAKPRT